MRTITTAALAMAAVGLSACATQTGSDETMAKATAMMKASFKARGQAKLDRLDQDEMQRVCSEWSGKAPPRELAARIEKENLDSIRWPADGQLLGDWKNGEKIAQDGRGKQYSDDPKGPVGGNCYACHQLTKEEISYGTIGPSLYHFARLRGYSEEMKRYAYGKIYNADAYNACSNMPRFGHNEILSQQQIKDLTALLMDPQSPVNQ